MGKIDYYENLLYNLIFSEIRNKKCHERKNLIIEDQFFPIIMRITILMEQYRNYFRLITEQKSIAKRFMTTAATRQMKSLNFVYFIAAIIMQAAVYTNAEPVCGPPVICMPPAEKGLGCFFEPVC